MAIVVGGYTLSLHDALPIYGLGRVTGAVVGDSFPAVFTGVRFTATQTGGTGGLDARTGGTSSDTVTFSGGSDNRYTMTGKIDPSALSRTGSDTANVSVPNSC